MATSALRTMTRCNLSVEEVYGQNLNYVRRKLASFGVPSADLNDVTHEVFIVVHAKLTELEHEASLRLWLRQICWRTASGYRRRAYRRLEVSSEEPPDNPREEEGSLLEQLVVREEVDRLHHALARLEAKQRDIFALHTLGELPVTEVARLANCDPKTARKKLQAATRRLKAILPERPSAGPPPKLEEAEWGDDEVIASELGLSPGTRVLAATHEIVAVLFGNVLIVDWRAAPTLDSLDRVSACGDLAVKQTRGSFAYLTIVEASCGFPSFDARRRIGGMLEHFSRNVVVYATSLEGGLAPIAKPIMTALSALARVPFPMRFFTSPEAAAHWVAASLGTRAGSPDATELADATAFARVYAREAHCA
jgi:RNA polymerase sigma-70 factor, ECF subfamily